MRTTTIARSCLPLSCPRAGFVRAVEFRTGAAPVHHAIIRVDRTQASRRRTAPTASPASTGVMAPDVQGPEGRSSAGRPASGPIISPPGMPWRLEQWHGPRRRTAPDSGPGANRGAADDWALLHRRPAGGRAGVADDGREDHRYSGWTRGLSRHRQLRVPGGRHAADGLSARALSRQGRPGRRPCCPTGVTRRLLHIPRWDFHWQQEYRFATPIDLPAARRSRWTTRTTTPKPMPQTRRRRPAG